MRKLRNGIPEPEDPEVSTRELQARFSLPTKDDAETLEKRIWEHSGKKRNGYQSTTESMVRDYEHYLSECAKGKSDDDRRKHKEKHHKMYALIAEVIGALVALATLIWTILKTKG